MHTLPLSFALLTYSGYWKPVNWTKHSFKYWLYTAYSVFMILLLHTFGICGLVDSFISKDMKTMIDKFYLSISVIGVCCKVANLFLRRDKIIGVVNLLLKENCIPRNEEERIIQRKFDGHAKNITIYCEVLNESAAFFATVAQLNTLVKTRTLPLIDWVPYDLSSEYAFFLSLLHQTVGILICANASVAHETLIAGLMIQVCAQLEILCYRARTLPVLLMEVQKYSSSMDETKWKKRQIIGNFIQHHRDVYDFALTINDVFNTIIFMQFSISSTVLCLSVYKMSMTDLLSLEFAWTFSYLCCMLMQVYLYCWFGNEVTLKSKQIGDAIYEMDWTTLPVDIKKNLLIIMARSTRPIKMSSGYIVTLSAQSFMSIIKLSYSAYNLLKDSSDK